ncbi:MAG: 2-oxoglutarate dehydrogenase, E2 component, dihydrolipoamide succinyltransferase [Ignavibacteriales bacterium]|jgi:2-oxoglutarate dehydrogenase E2 component (dihydrolipoamide succinyltransferase)|nr:MAG: 2-oxoglutarate dehydrogenase, E2 component, dihydrolipoamide succinyltransferase [Ignavibacteriales bacterium]
MKVDVVMPKMGESVNEGTIIKWHKKKGDKVEKDEIIFEISTDKVDTEIPSPENGILSDIKAFENETVEVGAVVAVIETNGEAAVEDSKREEETKAKEEPSTTQVGGELVDIPMPKMGESVMEGTIIKWHKKEGDKVERDEILFEISTDKVDTEVPSPVEGTLVEIITGENETVEVGQTVARVSSGSGIARKKESISSSSKPEKAKEEKVDEETKTETREKQSEQKVDTSSSDRFYSPLVMKIANTENVSYDELETIEGTGINGRVSKNDILKYIEDRKSGKTSAPKKPQQSQQTTTSQKPSVPKETAQPTWEAGEGVELIPMDNIRQRIMYHMVNSRDTSVHVTAVIETDMTKVHNFIQKNKQKFLESERIKLTYMPFISYAVIKALKEYPFLNASIDGNNIAVKKYINLGIAVAVEPNGLIVPNIKKADEKNIRGLTKSIMELSEKSRTKKLTPDDIMNGTFTITNYGVFGSLFGTPIINQPEVGILGIGSVTKKPVVVEVDGTDTIAIKPMMYLSLSHDHRLVDGMLGGKFLKSIKDTLENFDTTIF